MNDRQLIWVLIASGMTLIMIILLLLDQTTFHREKVKEIPKNSTYNIYAYEENNIITIKKCDLNSIVKEINKYTLDANGNVISASNQINFVTKLDAFRYKHRYEKANNCITKRIGSTLIHDIESEFKNKDEIISYINNFSENNKPIVLNKIK